MMDKIYMNRCVELASKALRNTYPNPMVGAVIVHNGKIIGEGYHRKAGEPHAEINAINLVKNQELLKESKIYVSLEPCAHFGKTPPCALKLKEIGFEEVIVGALDIHDKVNGKGINILEEAGIKSSIHILKEESERLNKRFFTFHEKKRPFIILKWVESADGFLDQNFQPTAISNALAKQWVHQLRADEHAILVGKNTALNDNPNLTTREVFGKNPVRVLIDFQLEVPLNFKIYNEEASTFIFNAIKNEEKGHLKFIKIEKQNFLENLMDKLYENQIQSIIIEGGRFTLQQFIDANLWDEAFIIKAKNKILENGTKSPVFSAKIADIQKLRDNDLFYFQNF
ncbi:MAG: bifunctional diaminohydroxyphosphoribosylaminopyrimidine deaminase/5-amino-6-(5-phosphoribosylamino)uracil reductase RibD [Flavobacteriaceae bacterium]|nr:bifunctional diaminohydroxyphosphoribosylaminopyrimidine deaminase/5-amino-6-(5-phosphoribosylamino)uracil reductase RibD [Flavobacteriaceae bacterium]